jgi:hypothetical protein
MAVRLFVPCRKMRSPRLQVMARALASRIGGLGCVGSASSTWPAVVVVLGEYNEYVRELMLEAELMRSGVSSEAAAS